jgi:hypothetical protein
MMNRSLLAAFALTSLIAACSSALPPTQRMADAEAAERSARELGANSEPAAQLSLKLATEQIGQAKLALADGDNRKADSLLIRAKADAELAIAQAREKGAKQAGIRAVADSAAQEKTNTVSGVAK